MFALLGAATSVFLAQTSSKQAQTVRLSLHCRDRPRNQQMWQTSKPKQRLILDSLLISSIDEKPDGRISCADGRSQISVTSSDQNINRISIGSRSPLSISFIHLSMVKSGFTDLLIWIFFPIFFHFFFSMVQLLTKKANSSSGAGAGFTRSPKLPSFG